jgi:hypothetical protein
MDRDINLFIWTQKRATIEVALSIRQYLSIFVGIPERFAKRCDSSRYRIYDLSHTGREAFNHLAQLVCSRNPVSAIQGIGKGVGFLIAASAACVGYLLRTLVRVVPTMALGHEQLDISLFSHPVSP